MIILVWMYLVYLIISVALTVWVAKTLHTNGRVFLVECFKNDEQLADSVNHLLLVGFYLINIGYVTLALKHGRMIEHFYQGIEVLSAKVGAVLVVLGIMHFFNLFVFSRMRKRGQLHKAAPPVQPTQFVDSTQVL